MYTLYDLDVEKKNGCDVEFPALPVDIYNEQKIYHEVLSRPDEKEYQITMIRAMSQTF